MSKRSPAKFHATSIFSLLIVIALAVVAIIIPNQLKRGLFNLRPKAAINIVTLKQTSPLIGNLRNMYASSVLVDKGTKKMWTCGWLDDSDLNNFLHAVDTKANLELIPGADKIWLSTLSGTSWSRPVKVFEKKGYHACDPSVVKPPSTGGVDRSNWLYMYYTALENRFATDAVTQIQNNLTGWATSVDGGLTWTDHGILIAKNQGGDGYGAWSPSAVVVGNQIWVYYHTGTPDFSKPITFLQKFDANGWTKIGTPIRLVFPEGISFNPNLTSTLLSNLDVIYFKNNFTLLANSLDLKNIVRFVSADGITWLKGQSDARIIQGGVNSMLTPHLEQIDTTSFSVYMGFANPPGIESKSIHRWDYSLK